MDIDWQSAISDKYVVVLTAIRVGEQTLDQYFLCGFLLSDLPGDKTLICEFLATDNTILVENTSCF